MLVSAVKYGEREGIGLFRLKSNVISTLLSVFSSRVL